MSTLSAHKYLSFKCVIHACADFKNVKSSEKIMKHIWRRKSIACGNRWKHLAIFWLQIKQFQAKIYLLYFYYRVVAPIPIIYSHKFRTCNAPNHSKIHKSTYTHIHYCWGICNVLNLTLHRIHIMYWSD